MRTGIVRGIMQEKCEGEAQQSEDGVGPEVEVVGVRG
jgi:hypothetical protein